jgi:hypothetical protein
LSLSETSSGWRMIANRAMLSPDVGALQLIGGVLVNLFRPRAKLEAEILVLRQQINVLRRTAPKRLLLSSIDRLIFVGLYRVFPVFPYWAPLDGPVRPAQRAVIAGPRF